MIRKLACLVVMGLMLAPVAALAQNAGKEKAAVEVAQRWLGLVDKGEYATSWKEAASYFHNHVTEKKWEKTLKEFREPLGKLEARTLGSATYRDSLPGAPEGRYVMMQFYTTFAKKKAAVENVISVLDRDGKWRVASYSFF